LRLFSSCSKGLCPPSIMVVTRTFSDGRTDGRSDDRTMAAGASVTWTHCSVLFEVTWNKTRRVRADMSVHADASPSPLPPSPLLPSPPLPSPTPSPSARTLGCVRADTKKNKNFVVVAGLEREKKITIFGFQSPKSLSSPGFAGEAARRRRFFRPSSPSHPSKLYSSLGWLNSKLPKPFLPFSLRLIDVDGF
jgi:hypothetical protein